MALSILTPGPPTRLTGCHLLPRPLDPQRREQTSPSHPPMVPTVRHMQVASDLLRRGTVLLCCSSCPSLLPLPRLAGIVNPPFGPARGLRGIWAARRSVTRAGHPLLLRRGDPLMVLADAAGREGPQQPPTAHPEITPDPCRSQRASQKVQALGRPINPWASASQDSGLLPWEGV